MMMRETSGRRLSQWVWWMVRLSKTSVGSMLFVLTIAVFLSLAAPAIAEELPIVGLLRAQAFNKLFDGYEFYHVMIESDLAQADGTHEVTAVASGKFLDNTKRVKVLFLVVGETVVGGQILDEKGMPPCAASSDRQASSL